MFKVGDRVEVVSCYNGSIVGVKGTVKKVTPDCAVYQIGVELDKSIGGHNLDGLCKDNHGQWFKSKDLKLIGGNMEIKVGQVWKYFKGSLKDIAVTIINPCHDTHKQGGQRFLGFWSDDNAECCQTIKSLLQDAKLITDIEGDNKMEKKTEKKIKINTIGLKLKMGVRTDDGVSGNIYSMSPQIVVVEDENGKHHSCQSKDVEILYSVPEEAVNPKTKIMTKAEARKLITQAKKVLNKK